MYKAKVILKNEMGLHARPASLFVKEAGRFSSNIYIEKDNNEYNAKSIISILCMAAEKGEQLIIKAEGDDEKESVEALKALIDNNFNKGG